MNKPAVKKTKSAEFFDILRKRINSDFYGYGEILLDITRLDIYVKDKKESINVYNDVKILIKRELELGGSALKKETLEKMDKIADMRISYLEGKPVGGLTYEDAVKYFRNFKYYPSIFSKKTLEKALEKRKLKDFAEVKTVFGNVEYYTKNGYPIVGQGMRKKKEHKAGWERTIDAQGVDLLLPSQYQLKEGEFLKDCLILEYPYLNKYPITTYSLDESSHSEFYVDVKDAKGNKKGSLYIPYRALKERSPEIAIKRMTEYFTGYYGKNSEALKNQLGLMDTKMAKVLFKDIKTGGVSK